MTISLNTQRIEDLARRIAARTGEDPGDAVERALLERLSRVESEAPRERKKASAADAMEIGRRAAARMTPEFRTMDIDAWLYDENGLPK